MSSPAEIPIVAAQSLSVRFGSLQALDHVSLTVPRGSITGLVGPNGAGKTTLIKILASLLLPGSGSATVGGFDVVRQAASVRRMIGYLPDFVGIYQDMKVVEYLRFFSDAHGLDRKARDAFIKRALELSGLGDRSESFIEELSRGMQSRLAFVRALAGSPELLLLDEPLSNLDPVARTDILAIIAKMREEDTSVLISSHILSDLEKICDRVVFILSGRVIREEGGEQAGGATYELKMAVGSDEAGAKLAGLEGIESADCVEGVENRFVLKLAAGNDPAEILRAIVEAGFAVLEWKPVVLSLEQRLVAAVKEDGGKA